MECAYYFDVSGGRHMECAYYFDVPGGRHMECAYYFDFCRLHLHCPQHMKSGRR